MSPRRTVATRKPPAARRSRFLTLEPLDAPDAARNVHGRYHGRFGQPKRPTLSLREAIELSNGTIAESALSTAAQAQVSGTLSDQNTIDFDIATTDAGYDPGSGKWTIVVDSALPAITTPVIIDATTQSGYTPATTQPASIGTGPMINLEGRGRRSQAMTAWTWSLGLMVRPSKHLTSRTSITELTSQVATTGSAPTGSSPTTKRASSLMAEQATRSVSTSPREALTRRPSETSFRAISATASRSPVDRGTTLRGITSVRYRPGRSSWRTEWGSRSPATP